MNRQTITAILAFVGTLSFVSIGFHILPTNIAIFVGIACFLAVGLAHRIMPGSQE